MKYEQEHWPFIMIEGPTIEEHRWYSFGDAGYIFPCAGWSSEGEAMQHMLNPNYGFDAGEWTINQPDKLGGVAFCILTGRQYIDRIKELDNDLEDYGVWSEPAAPALADDEFLSKRLARVAKLAGVLMPDMTHEQIVGVAGTILGQIASKLERAPAVSALPLHFVEGVENGGYYLATDVIRMLTRPEPAAPEMQAARRFLSGVPRDQFHDQAWQRYSEKAATDPMLKQLSAHQFRAIINAVFDAGVQQ
jgi:hypothetical protein